MEHVAARKSSKKTPLQQGRSSATGAYDMLLEAIEAGQLPPGTRLPENELAQRFAVSRTPIREALKRLETHGLVVHEPHHGAVVATLDYSQITEMYLMREVLEGTSAHLAAIHATAVEVELLREMIAKDRQRLMIRINSPARTDASISKFAIRRGIVTLAACSKTYGCRWHCWRKPRWAPRNGPNNPSTNTKKSSSESPHGIRKERNKRHARIFAAPFEPGYFCCRPRARAFGLSERKRPLSSIRDSRLKSGCSAVAGRPTPDHARRYRRGC